MASLIVRNRTPLRNGRNWSSFDEFENMVNRLFSGYSSYEDNSLAQMPIELTEKEDKLLLKAILPGLKKDDINIEVSEEQVSISGEYKSQYEENKDLIYRSEFFSGNFERTVSLPKKIEHQKAKADYKDGVLTLTLPKSEKETNKIVKLTL